MRITAVHKTVAPGCGLRRLILGLFCLGYFGSLMLAHPAHADSPEGTAHLFVPDARASTHPDPTQVAQNWLSHAARGLDNASLLQTAHNVRTDVMSAAQRIHNYQWLKQFHQGDQEYGTSVFRQLLKAVAKGYWNDLRENRLVEHKVIPDADGMGQVSWQRTKLDYRLRFSSDYVSLNFDVNF